MKLRDLISDFICACLMVIIWASFAVLILI